MALLSVAQQGTLASRDHIQRKTPSRTGAAGGHVALADSASSKRKGIRKGKPEADKPFAPVLAEVKPSQSGPSISTEIPFDPKSILPTTKPAKSVSKLLEASSLNKVSTVSEVVSFECIDGFTRTIEPLRKVEGSKTAVVHSDMVQNRVSDKNREQFRAFGIEAYPTHAVCNDICYDFVNTRRWCPRGSKCYRIHPLDKNAYLADAIEASVKLSRMRYLGSSRELEPEPSATTSKGTPTGTDGDLPVRVKLPPAPSLIPDQAVIECRHTSVNLQSTAIIPPGQRPSQSLPQHPPQKSVDDVQHWDEVVGLIDTQYGGRVSDTDSDNEREVDSSDGWSSMSDSTQHGRKWVRVANREASEWRRSEEACWSDSDKTSGSHKSKRKPSDQFVKAPRISRPSPTVVKMATPIPTASAGTCASLPDSTASQMLANVSCKIQPNQVVRPPRPMYDERCIKWLRDQCDRGYHCNYIHEDLEYDDKPRPDKLFRTLHNHIRVSFTSGFQVNELSTGFESPKILLCGLPDVPDSRILDILKPFGDIIEMQRPTSTTFPMTVRVLFSKTADAFNALTQLHGSEHFGNILETKMPVDGTGSRLAYQSNSLRIDYEAPCRNVYMGYANRLLAEQAVDTARHRPYEDFLTVANIHIGLPAVGKVTVKFQYVPVHVTQDAMKIFGPHQGMVTERPAIKDLTVQDMIRGVKRLLSNHQMKIVDMDFRPPPYKEGKMRAWVTFATPKDAQEAAQDLHGRRPSFMGSTKIYAKHMKSISFSLSVVRYRKVAQEIRELQERVWKQGGGYILNVTERQGFFSIRISGEDPKVLGRLKSEFERVLNGEPVYDDGKVVWDDFFRNPVGLSWLQNLERNHPGVIVVPILSRRMIRLFGVAEKRAVLRDRIIKKVAERRLRHSYVIPLNRHVVIAFAKDTEHGMPALEADIGRDNVTLDLWRNELIVSGDLDAYTTTNDVLNVFRQKHQMYRPGAQSGKVCPACISEPSSPMKLPCGHSWCRSCLRRYLKVATEGDTSFPLVCHGVEKKCGEGIPMFMAKSVLQVNEFDAIIDAALTAHIQTHPTELHYCPTPDCQQVYRSAPEGIFMQCPECLIRICTNCHSDAHDGLTCSEVHDGDDLFRDWVGKNGVKQCPNCKMAIEKSDGCNHMTCLMCKTHICWVCLETFKDGYAIYGHMQQKHGGSGI